MSWFSQLHKNDRIMKSSFGNCGYPQETAKGPSFVEFDPNYDQWQAGDRSRGHVELPSTSEMEKVRRIKISQFI